MYFGCRARATGSNRVNRGGSWNNTGTNLRSANRNNNNPSNRNNNIGFRVGFRAELLWNGYSEVLEKAGNAPWSSEGKLFSLRKT
jgi:hypothetical protein